MTKITYDKRQINKINGGTYRKDSTIILRVTNKERERIEKTASALEMNMSQAVRFILYKYFEQEYRNERQRAGAETPGAVGQEVRSTNQLSDRAVTSSGNRLRSSHRGNYLSVSDRERKDKRK